MNQDHALLRAAAAFGAGALAYAIGIYRLAERWGKQLPVQRFFSPAVARTLYIGLLSAIANTGEQNFLKLYMQWQHTSSCNKVGFSGIVLYPEAPYVFI